MKPWENAARYGAQSAIVKEALGTRDHSLDELLRLMREKDEAALYLAGTRLDNDYCFGSEDVGWLFSVHPEDGAKAAEPGYHPGSTEMYVTFQGQLTVECLEDGVVKEKSSSMNSIVLLPPGQCHRVPRQPDASAASLIVKTNLRHKPGVLRCDECGHHADKNQCPLFQKWQAEKVKGER